MTRFAQGTQRRSEGYEDHGSPGWRLVEHADGREVETWIYCPICLAQKDGWHKGDGTARYTGGTIPVRWDTPYGYRASGLAACTCFVGERFKARWEKQGMRIRDYTRYPPEDRTMPAEYYEIRTASGAPYSMPTIQPEAKRIDLAIPAKGM